MGATGPKPKPDALKSINGNPGKRALDLQAGVQPLVTTPPPPAHLSREAKAAWRQLAPQLAALGLMSDIYMMKFALLCHYWAEWVEAVKKVRAMNGKDGDAGIVQQSPNGYLQLSPYLVRADRCAEQVHKYGAVFGISPVDLKAVQASANQGADEQPAQQGTLDGVPPAPTRPTLAYFASANKPPGPAS